MDVYIKTEEETFHFPVNPLSVSVNGGKKYETFDIIYQGEKDFPTNAKKIRQLTIDTILPFEYEPYCRYVDIPDPVTAMKKLMGWSESDAIVRLIMTDYGFNELVNLSVFNDNETGDFQRDKYITLDFRVANGDNGIITIDKPAEKPLAPPLKPRDAPKKEKTYTVKSGDTLWAIAKKFYGNGAKYTKIYNKNKGVIGGNPNLIRPGQKYIIP